MVLTELCNPLFPIWVASDHVFCVVDPKTRYNTTPHCILDIWSLPYFASSLWNTRHLCAVPLSGHCILCLVSNWLVERVGIPCGVI